MTGSRGIVAIAIMILIGPSTVWVRAVPAESPSPVRTRTPRQAAAMDLIQRAIAFHDPQGLWSTGSFRLRLTSTRPGSDATRTTIIIDNDAGRFDYERHRSGHKIESTVTGADCWTRVDDSSALTPDQVQQLHLTCAEMRTIRDYHVYLYGLPMKLLDPGARVDPTVAQTRFAGHDVLQVRVTYDPEVGGDTWYFYFEPRSAALTGYRFYHDEAANDGEYIVLEGLAEGGGLRLPRARTWYRNRDHVLLGTDTIESIERLSRQR